MAKHDDPRVGQTVWTDEKKNGIIRRIDWQEKLVYSHHYDNGDAVTELDEFFGCFDERLNQWVITPI